jgi:predicted P-loop ATPase/GTPase
MYEKEERGKRKEEGKTTKQLTLLSSFLLSPFSPFGVFDNG